MTAEELKKKVIDTIVNTIHCEPEEVTPESDLRKKLNVDSLDVVEIIMNLEKEFNLAISDEDADKIDTVQDIIDYLTPKVLR